MALRKHLVQQLRKLAEAYDVERVPDNAGRERVKKMAEALLSAPLTAPDRGSAEESWKSYKESFQEGSFTEPLAAPTPPGRKFPPVS